MNIENIIKTLIITGALFSFGLGLIGLLGDFVNKWNDLEQQKINLETQRVINEICSYGGSYNFGTHTLNCKHAQK